MCAVSILFFYLLCPSPPPTNLSRACTATAKLASAAATSSGMVDATMVRRSAAGSHAAVALAASARACFLSGMERRVKVFDASGEGKKALGAPYLRPHFLAEGGPDFCGRRGRCGSQVTQEGSRAGSACGRVGRHREFLRCESKQTLCTAPTRLTHSHHFFFLRQNSNGRKQQLVPTGRTPHRSCNPSL